MRMVRLVFLHGIGEGGVAGDWHDALDAGLVRVGYPALAPDQVIAPRFVGLLKERPSPKAPMPDSTVIGMEDAEADRARWEYERRQASLEQLLGAFHTFAGRTRRGRIAVRARAAE
jgi:hypothetical protein